MRDSPSPPLPGRIPLDSKRLLVTGAGSGIGRSVAAEAAGFGARVIAADINRNAVERLVAELPGEGHLAIALDVSNAASVASGFAEVDVAVGGLDCLVHAAGVWFTRDDGPATRIADEVWAKTLAVNLSGTFFVCREAVRRMETQGAGAIVTLASVAALTGWEKMVGYSASKGGVLAFTRALAMDCARKNIRVNCLCPGVVETAMTAPVLSYSQPKVLPIGRLGKPEEIARSALFLCSDWASFTVGATIVADGGFSAA